MLKYVPSPTRDADAAGSNQAVVHPRRGCPCNRHPALLEPTCGIHSSHDSAFPSPSASPLLSPFTHPSPSFSQGNLIQCVDSADKLSTLLLEDTYASGAHLDFYDLP